MNTKQKNLNVRNNFISEDLFNCDNLSESFLNLLEDDGQTVNPSKFKAVVNNLKSKVVVSLSQHTSSHGEIVKNTRVNAEEAAKKISTMNDDDVEGKIEVMKNYFNDSLEKMRMLLSVNNDGEGGGERNIGMIILLLILIFMLDLITALVFIPVAFIVITVVGLKIFLALILVLSLVFILRKVSTRGLRQYIHGSQEDVKINNSLMNAISKAMPEIKLNKYASGIARGNSKVMSYIYNDYKHALNNHAQLSPKLKMASTLLSCAGFLKQSLLS